MIETIQNFFLAIWEVVVFIVYILVLLVMIPFSGKTNTLIKDCVPKLEYVSTSDISFIFAVPLNETLASRGYDPIDLLDKNESYVNVHLNNTGIDRGTKLKLLGDVMDRVPQGIVKANSSRHIYIKAKIDNYIVWFPLSDLELFYKINNILQNRLHKVRYCFD